MNTIHKGFCLQILRHWRNISRENWSRNNFFR